MLPGGNAIGNITAPLQSRGADRSRAARFPRARSARGRAVPHLVQHDGFDVVTARLTAGATDHGKVRVQHDVRLDESRLSSSSRRKMSRPARVSSSSGTNPITEAPSSTPGARSRIRRTRKRRQTIPCSSTWKTRAPIARAELRRRHAGHVAIRDEVAHAVRPANADDGAADIEPDFQVRIETERERHDDAERTSSGAPVASLAPPQSTGEDCAPESPMTTATSASNSSTDRLRRRSSPRTTGPTDAVWPWTITGDTSRRRSPARSARARLLQTCRQGRHPLSAPRLRKNTAC